MDINIIVPDMGESIIEATVARWMKKVGDPIAIGESLVELETNKANLEVPADRNGTLSRIDHNDGEDVHVGDVLGTMTVKEDLPGKEPKGEKGPKEINETKGPNNEATKPAEKITPVASRILRENAIEPSQIIGSGAGGTIVKEDVEKFLAHKDNVLPETVEVPLSPRTMPYEPVTAQEGREERIRLSRRRRTIAQNLVQTQHAAAMLTTFNDVDMSAVMKMRQDHKQVFRDKYGISLGITSFFVKASILALKDYPRLNAELQGDEMVIKHYYDIGIAIGDEEGLVVPILRDADRLTFVEMEISIRGFAEKIQKHTLSLQDIMGGTFTITNGGVFGSLMSTPILNGPEVGILGLHRIEDRPIVVGGKIEIRPMMFMALSYDHRIVDGREAVQFLARVKHAIEDPEVLLLGI